MNGWYDFHAKAFEGMSAGAETQIRAGVLKTAAGRYHYVATVFQDEIRLDKFGRPIFHYIAWVLEGGDSRLESVRMPRNWGVQLARLLGEEIDKIYSFQAFSGEGGDAEQWFSHACHRRELLSLGDADCSLIPVDKEVEIIEDKSECDGSGAESAACRNISGCVDNGPLSAIQMRRRSAAASEMPAASPLNWSVLAALLQGLISRMRGIVERLGKHGGKSR
ncbi:hypothetical protein [Azohydromonas caseinilytica]|uniref:Uncharacterized protein n=1 Tax=Azohydromonas caseinilytica TaxID=2728836 RepID=A0A848F5P6_9BURK|nr:hypothetical protein [Azohydromonas caseinilytica]NML14722.1 hypothetical protein [Azohydromonas caseinilytica]